MPLNIQDAYLYLLIFLGHQSFSRMFTGTIDMFLKVMSAQDLEVNSWNTLKDFRVNLEHPEVLTDFIQVPAVLRTVPKNY